MGVPLEERREGRTSRTPEFMDALESADTYREALGHPSSRFFQLLVRAFHQWQRDKLLPDVPSQAERQKDHGGRKF